MPRAPAKKHTTQRNPARALEAPIVSIPDYPPTMTNGSGQSNVFAPNIFPFDTSWLDLFASNNFLSLQYDMNLFATNCFVEHGSEVLPFETSDPLFWTQLEMELGLTTAPLVASQPSPFSANNPAVTSANRMQGQDQTAATPLALFKQANEHRDATFSEQQSGNLTAWAPLHQATITETTQPSLPFIDVTSGSTDPAIQRLLSDAKEALLEMKIGRNVVKQRRESQS
ncbi:hypothetical protein BC830DRAFT_1174871 [Chytriomyces sp. MP71]|nr:hypothetical protein BC830DRAFT_1174871 [Chytriomyces sp. MP71]